MKKSKKLTIKRNVNDRLEEGAKSMYEALQGEEPKGKNDLPYFTCLVWELTHPQ